MSEDTIDIIVYSDDYTVRDQVIEAVGKRAAKGQPAINWTQAATANGLQIKIHDGNFPIAIVDGEATKISGLTIAKTISEEEDPVPFFIALTARPQDDWLAEFSGVGMTVLRPLNPIKLQEAVAEAIDRVR